MASSDFEASEYGLGVTSVRLIRVCNVIQLVFSKKVAAQIYYAAASTRFKKDEENWKTR